MIDRATRAGRGGVVLAVAALAAGAAAMAEDRPDLTGIWGTYGGAGFGGPSVGLDSLPLKPDARERVEDYRALVDPSGATPGGFCLGAGMPGSMLGSGPYPMEIVQHEELIVVIYEAHTEVRHIYLGDRAADEELFPDRNGYSFGRWEGDKLIVETTHLKDAITQSAYPHSDEARIVTEYEVTGTEDGRRVLTARMTMTDPAFYTEPVTTEKQWLERPDARLLPYDCNETRWLEHLEALRAQRGSSGGQGGADSEE